MKTTQLLYASRAVPELNNNDIESILKEASQFNQCHQITGLLSYSDYYFIQCIEGQRTAINHLYNRIVQDSRHHSAEILLYQTVDKRLFPQWSMEFIPLESIRHIVLSSTAQHGLFNPFELSHRQCINLLYSLADLYRYQHSNLKV